jgi:hypothetical protein
MSTEACSGVAWRGWFANSVVKADSFTIPVNVFDSPQPVILSAFKVRNDPSPPLVEVKANAPQGQNLDLCQIKLAILSLRPLLCLG